MRGFIGSVLGYILGTLGTLWEQIVNKEKRKPKNSFPLPLYFPKQNKNKGLSVKLGSSHYG